MASDELATNTFREKVGEPASVDGRPGRAMATLSRDGDGVVRIWHVDLAGEACGAWTLDSSVGDEALTILYLCDRRAIIQEQDTAQHGDREERRDGQVDGIKLLKDAAETFGLDGLWLDESAMAMRTRSVAGLVNLTTEARNQFEQSGGGFPWTREFPSSVAELMHGYRSGWAEVGGEPAAFRVAIGTRRAINLWNEVERVRVRRPALRNRFGPRRSLPEPWQDAITSADGNPFPLPPHDPTSPTPLAIRRL